MHEGDESRVDEPDELVDIMDELESSEMVLGWLLPDSSRPFLWSPRRPRLAEPALTGKSEMSVDEADEGLLDEGGPLLLLLLFGDEEAAADEEDDDDDEDEDDEVTRSCMRWPLCCFIICWWWPLPPPPPLLIVVYCDVACVV
jgi:hypothetical protein